MTAKFWLSYGDDGILRVRICEFAEIEAEDAVLYVENFARVAGSGPSLVLVDATASHTITREAQEYIAKHLPPRIATAVVTTNAISMMFTNLYVSLFKPANPVRIFKTEEDAVEWLRKMKEEYTG